MTFQNPVVEVRTQAENIVAWPSPHLWESQVQCLTQLSFMCQNISRCFYTGVFRQAKSLTLQTLQPGRVLGSCSRKTMLEMYSESWHTCRDVLLEASLQMEDLSAKAETSKLMHQPQCFFDFEYWQHISSVQYPSNTISNICFKIKHYLSLPE